MSTAEIECLNFFENPLAGVEPILLNNLGSKLGASTTEACFDPAIGSLA